MPVLAGFNRFKPVKTVLAGLNRLKGQNGFSRPTLFVIHISLLFPTVESSFFSYYVFSIHCIYEINHRSIIHPVAYIDFSKGGGHEIFACQNQPVNENRAVGAINFWSFYPYTPP